MNELLRAIDRWNQAVFDLWRAMLGLSPQRKPPPRKRSATVSDIAERRRRAA